MIMNRNLFLIGAAAILSGCCSCPKPCPWLVGKPEGTECPRGGLFCECVPTPAPVEPALPPPPPPPQQVTTIGNTNVQARIEHVPYKQVVLDGFADEMKIMDVRRSKTNDGYDRVQVFAKNLSGDRMRIRYRFNWVNNDGVEVRDPDHDAWESLTVAAGDDVSLTSIEPRKECYDFKLRMKKFD